jgi:hypothetical protein
LNNFISWYNSVIETQKENEMLLSIQQLASLNLIPKTGYKMGKAFPVGFKPAASVSNDVWKKLPLFIQVRYEYTPVNDNHTFKG